MPVMLEPCFQATIWLDRMEDCREWIDGFLRKGIPCGIVRRSRGAQYSVWRNGIESGEGYSKWRDEFVVVVAYNGFEGRRG